MTGIYKLARGNVNGRIFQNLIGGRNGDEERVTGAGIGLTRDINTVSRFGLDFRYVTEEDQDNPELPTIGPPT